MRKLLLATTNPGKVREIEAALAAMNLTIVTRRDLKNPPIVVETGSTFEENAKLKAHQLAEFSGLPTLADDSGLRVDKLNGQPGIYSARYAGEEHNDAHNNAKLLAELGGVPEQERSATFYSTIVVAWPGQFDHDLEITGSIAGQILTTPRGDNDFGYDPLFYIPEKGKTFAEMTVSEKNQISHRGIALRKLEATLPAWWEDRTNG